MEHKKILDWLDDERKQSVIHYVWNKLDDIYWAGYHENTRINLFNNRENDMSDVFDIVYPLVKDAVIPDEYDYEKGEDDEKYQEDMELYHAVTSDPIALAVITINYMSDLFSRVKHTYDDDYYFSTVLQKISEMAKKH